MDKIKFTIMEMLKKEFPNISVVDTPIDKVEESKKLLFKEAIDDCTIKIIDYEEYDKYMKEVIPQDIPSCVYINDEKYNVVSYEDGVLTLDKPVSLFEYNDIIEIKKTNDSQDFIMCYTPYGYSKTIDGGLVEYYNRYNVDIFINDDLHNDNISMYRTKIGRLFNRDFLILNNGIKTKEKVYVVTQMAFNLVEYNITNKILRGSMLLKTYSYE